MENFTIYNPVKLHFGKNVTNDLGKTVKKYGNRVLLIYGKGSIKKNGIYDQIIEQFQSNQIYKSEYSGIKSNPVIEDVNKATLQGIETQAEVIVAVGGGSVIDTAKIVSLTIANKVEGWDIMTRKEKPQKALPIISVLTLAATGTEMNMFAVLQNSQTLQKVGYGHPFIYPKHSFIDPSYTMSVSKNYTAYGATDIIAHALESFFGYGNSPLADKFVASIITEIIEITPDLLDNLTDYDLRSRMLLASTCALNGITTYGKQAGDWGVHAIGHVLSVLYDIPHGASLSIAYPAWLQWLSTKKTNRITQLGYALFNADNPIDTIAELKCFFTKINTPVRLSELENISVNKNEIYETMVKNNANGYNYSLNKKDYMTIIEYMFEN